MKFQTTDVNGLDIFYREAGDPSLPTMVLFHGFPSASHMFRDLMPLLSDRFHVIAPDYPGFGQSSSPKHTDFKYTFDNLTTVMTAWLEKLNLDKFYMYVFDYGAPIGFRIAAAHPDWIQGIVSQNGNIYQEGLGSKWATRQDFWDNPTPAKRDTYRGAFALETIKGQYTFGTRPGAVSPDGYMLDYAYTTGDDYAERQLDLIYDYQNNIKLYPKFQEYLRENQPRLLAVWGKNDPSFIYPGAEAFKNDDKNATVELIDSGHFALETHAAVIATMIKQTF
ncbi:hydrolase [Lactiplantibacillus fabifermentans T30PCM01]|uniref:Hydrolase n=1 Tax=Lactiplantibacillus fabifermentans T30PCM01 TaxID=1400520 RepID=W6T7U9_9LACO|nr:alpha/beta hydrolase [Lactiplantibacillus fabifermentans]ETY74264.1 hydrolase [Lactiplantibacillus fabifermentans T30PCM01]